MQDNKEEPDYKIKASLLATGQTVVYKVSDIEDPHRWYKVMYLNPTQDKTGKTLLRFMPFLTFSDYTDCTPLDKQHVVVSYIPDEEVQRIYISFLAQFEEIRTKMNAARAETETKISNINSAGDVADGA